MSTTTRRWAHLLLEHGRDDLAGAAPRRVEIDEDGLTLGKDSLPLRLAMIDG